MIKLVECLRRLPHLSHQEFLDYWHDVHGPLVVSLAKDLRMGRYVQCHGIVHPVHDAIRTSHRSLEPFDGVAEVWFASREAMEPTYSTAAMKEANRKLREDEARFLDWPRCVVFFTEERVMIP